MEVARLSDDEHEAVVEALNERIQGQSWTYDTELLARLVDIGGAILAHLQSGLWTAQADPKKGKFGRAEYPTPVERPEWVTEEASAVASDDVPVVTPGQLATMLMD